MIRSRIVCAAVLSGLAVMPAAAADPPLMTPTVVEAPAASPYYVVNQGPEFSGPGIIITEIGLTGTDLQRSYPFIGRYDDRIRLAVRPDYYGTYPSTTYTAPKVLPRKVRRKPKGRRTR